jgi:hypothetical protein
MRPNGLSSPPRDPSRPAESKPSVAQILAITCPDLVLPLFSSLDEALAPRLAAVIRPLRPRLSAGRHLSLQPGLPDTRV